MRTGVAIVGMACRFADARNPTELWENVLSQRRAFRRLPPERLRLEDYYSPNPADPDKTYARWAALIEGWQLDRVRYRVVGSTFRSADLAHWLALDVAASALEDAGFGDGRGLPRPTTAVILGNTLTGEFSRANTLRLRWPYVRRVVRAALEAEGRPAEQCVRFLQTLEAAYKAPFPPSGEESLAGGLSNTIAGRICNYFDLNGGGYTVDGACAASLLAIINACTLLQDRDIDVALSGGVDLSLDPFELVGFAKTGALAPERMRVYDARSAGFWPGEGCGIVVLMRAEDAMAQNRRVYAIIRGWGVSSDGSGGLTRPEVEGQLLAIQRAYRRAGLDVASVGYFEGHGTGTDVGDAVELQALSRARREASRDSPPAALGSIKANIGHTKAAAGAAGLIKAAMALHEQVLPPTTGCDVPHPELAVKEPALRIVRTPEPWPAQAPLVAGVSAMGFGGINSHVVLEGVAEKYAAPLNDQVRNMGRALQDVEVFLLDAKDRASLVAGLRKLATAAVRLSFAEMGDAAASLAAGLVGGTWRAAIIASDPIELAERTNRLIERLETEPNGLLDPQPGSHEPQADASELHAAPLKPDAGSFEPPACLVEQQAGQFDTPACLLEPQAGLFAGSGSSRPRIGFLFPGQGSPARLDGGGWRRRFESVERLYANTAFPSEGDGVATQVAQPAIVTASLAVLSVLQSVGVQADVAVGHSLGELTALHWAGAMDAPALCRIATARGRAMAELGSPTGAMAGIRAHPNRVREMLSDETVRIAGLNSPSQTVVSGPAEAVEALVVRARKAGLAATRLPVSHAFHSPLVEAAVPALERCLRAERLGPLERPVASTIAGTILPREENLVDLLCRQVTHPVRFMEALAAAKDVRLWIEVGPGEVLAGLARDCGVPCVVATDACGPSLRSLLEVVATAFVMGCEIRPCVLFEDRYLKPFDWRRPLRFLANPCETAPIDEPTGDGRRHVEQDGDAAQRMHEEALRPGTSDLPASQTGESATMPQSDKPLRSPVEVVRRLVAERTELPPSAVTDDSRLLSDLHLNSISVTQIVRTAAGKLGLPSLISGTEFADSTVAGVGHALEELARRNENGGSISEQRWPAGVDSWIRPFVVEFVDAPLDRRPARGEAQGRWEVLASADHPLARPLSDALNSSGLANGVAVCLPEEPSEQHVSLLLDAARAVLGNRSASRFLLVQHGGGGAAFAKTLHLERPVIQTIVVDVPPRCAESIAWIMDEVRCGTGYCQAQYDAAGRRRVPLLRPLEFRGLQQEAEKLSHDAKQPRTSARALPQTGSSETASEPTVSDDDDGREKRVDERVAAASRRAAHPADAAANVAAATDLGKDDVLLVTGGGRGIATECALAYAKRTGVRLALLGRSDPTTDEELTGNLRRLAAAGVSAAYYRGDVTSEADVRRAIAQVRDEQGEVTAFWHAAGINVPCLLTSLQEDAFRRTLAVKVGGARNVLAALDAETLRLFVAFGSLIAQTGMPGEADYAVANDWLARCVERWAADHPRCRCLAVEWSVWSGVGMGQRLGRVEALMQQGVTPIPIDEGVGRLEQLLMQPAQETRVVVSGRFGTPPTIALSRDELPLWRFLEKPQVHYPGVELVVDADLSVTNDPYLNDHVLHGDRLLPAVMGLEAMAQTAMAVCETSEPPAFRDVEFARGIIVPPDRPLRIRVAALVREPGRVEVVIRSGETGFQLDHFKATCLLPSGQAAVDREPAVESRLTAETVPAVEHRPSVDRDGRCPAAHGATGESFSRAVGDEVVPIDPQQDLYGRLLFHEGRFRRLRGYRRLQSTRCEAEIAPAELTDWFGAFLPGHLVLGDAAVRDAAIHAIQACIPHARLLPIGVGAVTLSSLPASQVYSVEAEEQARQGDVFVYDLRLRDAQGRCVETWRGLRLQAVEEIPLDGATAAPLLIPYAERRAADLLAGACIRLAVLRDGMLDRHERSEQAIRQALGGDLPILRRPDGRPAASDSSGSEPFSVSASHAGELTIAVAAPGPVGCDVEPVESRSRAVWQTILGSAPLALAELVARETGGSLDLAATRVWTAIESRKKAGAAADAPLVYGASTQDGWVLLRSGALTAATFSATLRDDARRWVIAMALRTDGGGSSQS